VLPPDVTKMLRASNPDVTSMLRSLSAPAIPAGVVTPNLASGSGGAGTTVIHAPITFNGAANVDQMVERFAQRIKTLVPGVGVYRQ